MQENKIIEQLSKKEQWEFQKQENKKLEESRKRKKQFWKMSKQTASLFLISGIIGLSVWYVVSQPKISENEIISRNGIHWHSNLEVYVKGVRQDIPADIGIGAVHQPMHTHAGDNTIHLEFSGLTTKKDLKLGNFFKNWGRDFRSFGTPASMTVNGKENTELENYVMKDNDRIEIKYE